MGKHDPLQPAGMRLHIQWASLSLDSVSHDITRAKEVQSAKKKQPTGNKASEARRVGRTLQLRGNITQSFHWNPDSSALTSSWGEIKENWGAEHVFISLVFLHFTASVMND